MVLDLVSVFVLVASQSFGLHFITFWHHHGLADCPLAGNVSLIEFSPVLDPLSEEATPQLGFAIGSHWLEVVCIHVYLDC